MGTKREAYAALFRLTASQRSLLDRLHAVITADLDDQDHALAYGRYEGAILAIADGLAPGDDDFSFGLPGLIRQGHYEADQSRGTGEEADYRDKLLRDKEFQDVLARDLGYRTRTAGAQPGRR